MRKNSLGKDGKALKRIIKARIHAGIQHIPNPNTTTKRDFEIFISWKVI